MSRARSIASAAIGVPALLVQCLTVPVVGMAAALVHLPAALVHSAAAGIRLPRRWWRSPHRVRIAGAVVVVAAVLVGSAGGLQRLRLDTTINSFLPSHDQSFTTWHEEESSFGGDPIAVLLTSRTPEGLLSGAPLTQLVQTEGELSQLPNVSVVYGPGTTLNEISLSVRNLVADISGTRDGLMSKAEAAARKAGDTTAEQTAAGQAAVYQFDLRYGALLAEGLQGGLPELSNATFDRTVFFGSDNQPRPAFRWLVPDTTHVSILVRPAPNLTQGQTRNLVDGIHAILSKADLPVSATLVTGTPVIAYALGHEVTSELPLLAGASTVAVAIFFLLTRRRRWWERLVPLGVGVVATLLTLAIFGWCGVPLSLGLMAFLPIILGVGTDYPIYALRGGRPTVLMAVTVASAASLAILTLSPLPYVRDLGLALATGLLISTLLGLLLARALHRLPARRRRVRRADAPGGRGWRIRQALAPARTTPNVRFRPVRLGPSASRTARRRRAATVAVAVVALGLGLTGWLSLGSLGLNSDPQRLAAGLPALRQSLTAQAVLGTSGELDVYVRGNDVFTPAFLTWYEQAQDTIILNQGNQVRPIVSPSTLLSWIGKDPTAKQLSAALNLLPSYLTTAAVRDDHKQAILAFGVQLGSLGSDEALVQAIRRELPPPPAGATVSVTGLPAVAGRSYQLLSGNRLLPNLGGLVAFGLVLLLLLRRPRTAALAVLAAALAAGWGFCLLRVTGTPLTPLTVSLGSLTSAVGGEFAVMALARRQAGAAPFSAVTVAAGTSIIGFAALGLSRLAVLRQFGLVLAASVLLALLAARAVVAITAAPPRPAGVRRPGRIPTGAGDALPGAGNGSVDAEQVLV
jgi:predicted RND superfamily exporter protein